VGLLAHERNEVGAPAARSWGEFFTTGASHRVISMDPERSEVVGPSIRQSCR